jgi:N-acetylmuramic acid 6-phosphate etherase
MAQSRDRQVFDEIAGLTTEAVNPRSADLDRKSVPEILSLINDEDQTVPGAVRREIDAISRAVDLVVARLARGGRLFYIGAGTSGRLGVLDAAECPPTFGSDPKLVQGIIAGGHEALWRAVEGAEDEAGAAPAALTERGVNAGDVVVGVAASRRTPFVLAGLRYARQVGAGTILLSMNAAPDSQAGGASGAPSDLEVDVAICPVVGPEVVMGSTRMKAGTAQKLILNMISTATMVRLGKVYGNLMVDLQATSRKLAERAKRLVMMTVGVDYDGAAQLLEEAGGSVKAAIVIGRLGVTREEAAARLKTAQGFVGTVLAEEGR